MRKNFRFITQVSVQNESGISVIPRERSDRGNPYPRQSEKETTKSYGLPRAIKALAMTDEVRSIVSHKKP